MLPLNIPVKYLLAGFSVAKSRLKLWLRVASTLAGLCDI